MKLWYSKVQNNLQTSRFPLYTRNFIAKESVREFPTPSKNFQANIGLKKKKFFSFMISQEFL